MIDNRKRPQIPEQELYKLSPIKEFIAKERRHDELSRLNEVIEQKRVWRNIIFACFLLNLMLIVFAVMGYIQNV